MKKGFIFNISWKEALSGQPDDIRLKVYEAVIDYAADGTAPSLDPVSMMAFSFIKSQLDITLEKYEDVVRKRSEAGKRGSEKRWATKEKQAGEDIANDSKNGKCYVCHDMIANDSKNSKASQTMANITNIANKNNIYNKDNNISSKEDNKKENLKRKKSDEVTVDIAPKQRSQDWLEVFDFSEVDNAYLPALLKWLDYKKSRREKYKTQASFYTLYKRLKGMGTPEDAMAAVDFSMSSNYSGLFPDRNNKARNNENTEEKRQEMLTGTVGRLLSEPSSED